MTINWDVVAIQANQKSHAFAKSRGHIEDSTEYCICFNAYHSGYMENAGERESLRAINEKLRKAEPIVCPDLKPITISPGEIHHITEPLSDLADLI